MECFRDSMAYMEWAEAKCSRNNLKTSPSNIRTQLGELINRVSFEKLTLEHVPKLQYSQYFVAYNEFFDDEEIVTTNHKIRLQNHLS